MSHHVTCHVTVVSHASSSSKRKIKEKRKENQYKIRNKLLVFKHPITVNTRELSGVPSTDMSALYTSSAWSVYTLYLAYSKYYKLYR